MALTFKSFVSQNWIIAPAALATNEPKPRNIADQRWGIVLTGVGILDLQGNSANDWRHERIHVLPDLDAPLRFAINKYNIPRPARVTAVPAIDLEQWASFAAIGSLYNRSISVIDVGVAVDSWQHHPLLDTTDVDGDPAHRVFTGIDVDVAIRNNSSTLLRMSYNINMIGRIVFLVGGIS